MIGPSDLLSRIDHLLSVAGKATEGEWEAHASYIKCDGKTMANVAGYFSTKEQSEFNVTAIVTLHNEAPALLTELRAEIVRLRGLVGEEEAQNPS